MKSIKIKQVKNSPLPRVKHTRDYDSPYNINISRIKPPFHISNRISAHFPVEIANLAKYDIFKEVLVLPEYY